MPRLVNKNLSVVGQGSYIYMLPSGKVNASVKFPNGYRKCATFYNVEDAELFCRDVLNYKEPMSEEFVLMHWTEVIGLKLKPDA